MIVISSQINNDIIPKTEKFLELNEHSNIFHTMIFFCIFIQLLLLLFE